MTTQLHLVRLQGSRSALWRATFGDQGRAPLREPDEGYMVHAALRSLFGDVGPQPFAVDAEATDDARRGDAVTVYGYASADADRLIAAAKAGDARFSHAFELGRLASKPMPSLTAGMRLALRARCVVSRRAHCDGGVDLGGRRKTRWSKGDELDAYVLECARVDPHGAGDCGVKREDVYAGWLAERLATGGASLADPAAPPRVVAWRRVRLLRRGGVVDGRRPGRAVELPEATFDVEIVVQDPVAFDVLLRRGIGRHRAFGYGMALLRPPRS